MKRPPTAKKGKTKRASSPAFRALEKAIGLTEADWKALQAFSQDGLDDFQRDDFFAPALPIRYCDLPDDWYNDPEALGFVTVRVIQGGETRLATAFARYFLTICDPGPGEPCGPPGAGLAWLYLSRQGIAPPIETARLAELAFFMPQDFFGGVGLDDLLPLSRLVLENRPALEAWDLHALIAAVAEARVHARAPFDLFDRLMSADWIAADVKREFCRGVLFCVPEFERLRQKCAVIKAALQSVDNHSDYPRVCWHLLRGGVGVLHPGLVRHAVKALVESLGDPIEDVVSEFYLKHYHDSQSSLAVSEGVLGLLSSHSEELGEDAVKRWLRKGAKSRLASIRRAAYRVGAELFGEAFARPALEDSARGIREWARAHLSDHEPKRRR